MQRQLAKSSSRELARRAPNPQLAAVVELFAHKEVLDYVLQLEPLGLETTKMMLQVLQHVESTYHEQSGKHLSKAELASVLDTVLRHAATRQQIIQLYQERKRG